MRLETIALVRPYNPVEIGRQLLGCQMLAPPVDQNFPSRIDPWTLNPAVTWAREKPTVFSWGK